MPAWLFPLVKAVLPHIGTIVSAAAPVFTRKSAATATNQPELLQQQITELQAATSKNDAHIKELAEQIQHALLAMEQGASIAARRHQQMYFLCFAATILSVVALCIALFMLATR
ncbi:MAG: hypothetical protein Q8N00_12625 [Nitrospirota bacterium]|nr:hypothetical protein [Nitrospirota bacterium]MDP3596422.1 hypothetical protein [Nitrospirota bacterium]